MGKPVQLKLWVDDPERVEVQCDHCGHRFNALPQLKHGEYIRKMVMEHPIIQALTQAQKDFISEMPADFLGGDRSMGITDMSDWAGLSKPGATWHVKRLAQQGVIIPKPKCEGGRYNVYQFAFPNGNTPIMRHA